MQERIQCKLRELNPELEDRHKIIEYYVGFEFPEKQTRMIKWWQSMIEQAVRVSGELYLTPASLATVFSLHGLKTVPLKEILQYLASSQGVARPIQWRDRQSISHSNKNQNTGWFANVLSSIWKPVKSDTSPSSSANDLDDTSKVIPVKFKVELEEQLLRIVKTKCEETHQATHVYQSIVSEIDKLSGQSPLANLSKPSLNYLFKLMEQEEKLFMDLVGGERIIYYSSKSRALNQQWRNVEKSKYQLQKQIEKFAVKIMKLLSEEDKCIKQSKVHYQNDDKKATKAELERAVRLRRVSQEYINRRKLLEDTLFQLQNQEISEITIDLVKQSQQVLSKTMTDSSELDALRERNISIQANQHEMNDTFKEISDEHDLEKDIDQMMNELQTEINNQKSKGSSQPMTTQSMGNQQHRIDMAYQ